MKIVGLQHKKKYDQFCQQWEKIFLSDSVVGNK